MGATDAGLFFIPDITEEPRKVIGEITSRPTAAGPPPAIHYGQGTVANYAVKFGIVARRSVWSTASLVDMFLQGLADYIKDILVA